MTITLKDKETIKFLQTSEPGVEISYLFNNISEANNFTNSIRYYLNTLRDLSIKVYRRKTTVNIKKRYWRRYFYNE